MNNMNLQKRYMSLKRVFVYVAVLCVVAILGNLLLRRYCPSSFKITQEINENGVSSALITSQDGKYMYRMLETDKIEISSYTNYEETDVVIPEIIDGKLVTSIGEAAFSFHNEIKTLVIPKSVETIKLAAFGSSENMERIMFEGDILTIEEFSFVDFDGTVVADKNSNIYRYAEKNQIKTEEK